MTTSKLLAEQQAFRKVNLKFSHHQSGLSNLNWNLILNNRKRWEIL